MRYYLFTFNVLLLPIYYVLDRSSHVYHFTAFGLAAGPHLATIVKESHPGQKDLRTYGRFLTSGPILLLVLAQSFAG